MRNTIRLLLEACFLHCPSTPNPTLEIEEKREDKILLKLSIKTKLVLFHYITHDCKVYVKYVQYFPITYNIVLRTFGNRTVAVEIIFLVVDYLITFFHLFIYRVILISGSLEVYRANFGIKI